MFLKHALFSLQKTEGPFSKTLQRMNFLFKTQFSYSENGNSYNFLVLVVKNFLVLFCALFPTLFGFFRYFKSPVADEQPFSALSFRFPTYKEFLTTTENFDTSNENDVLGENPSNSDPDFNLDLREDPEKISSNGLNCTNDIKFEDLGIKGDDEFDESMEEAISGGFERKIEVCDEIEYEEKDFIEELQIEIMKAKAKAKAKSGLPSIPEECEYPIKEEDLNPWKKQESFNYRDITKELNRFHKLYTEQMRKYDTLNHQKSYAKGQF